MCTGMLPAAALAVSNTVGQLLDVSPHMVRIALRLGLTAWRRSNQLESSTESWAAIVSGPSPLQQQAAIDEFHRQNVSISPSLSYLISLLTVATGPPSKQACLPKCGVNFLIHRQRPSFDHYSALLFL